MSSFKVKWIYVLDKDFTFDIKSHLPPDFSTGCSFQDRDGKCWLEILPNGMATVFANYAWDGCTPKFSILDILIGTPDGIPNSLTKKPKTYYASLMHDVLYQFLDAGSPVSRAGADKVFLELMKRDEFAPRYFYYLAVRVCGDFSRRITGRHRQYAGRKTALQTRTLYPAE
jgi:hypothetical protein